MYAERIRLINYGPIEHVDIAFPFEERRPKPVVLVGDSGSGKSVLQSHIVNGLTLAQTVAFPESADVQTGKVYKLRSTSYIKPPHQYYFGSVDFSGGISIGEIRTQTSKRQGDAIPSNIVEDAAQQAWTNIPVGENDYQFGPAENQEKVRRVKDAMGAHCVLYLPPNRFEEPAWLNVDNLNAKANHMDLSHITGHTNRHIIHYSPMREVQHWLFEVVYDRVAFELQTVQANIPVQRTPESVSVPVSLFLGYRGQSTDTYHIALNIVQQVIRRYTNVRFGIGPRHNRAVSLVGDGQTVVPNIFQLASGELSLLALFLTIVRDYDLCGEGLASEHSIKGIVVVDEIETHLSVVQQNEILPKLIKLFPNVQFVVTTHSALFVLGMEREFGTDGFGLYRLPEGHQISPEEFSEFGNAYHVFTDTATFSDDVRNAIRQSHMPIVYVDGATDVKYVQRAADLLGRSYTKANVELRPAGGDSQLAKIWNSARLLGADLTPEKVVILHDCDSNATNTSEGNVFRRVVPLVDENPITRGVENLLSESTLKKAMDDKPAFIDVTPEHPSMLRGDLVTIPEQWVVNPDEKGNLCDWICANGVADDFAGFSVIFEILDEILVT